MNEAVGRGSGSGLVHIGVPLAIATLIFLIFPVLSEAYELQLREFSAWMAEVILRVTYLDVSRQGTILSLPGMTFDIIPACSGSEMLRTLIFVGILWGGIHPRISPVNKLIATAIAALIALLANGVRLSLLLGFSYLRGDVIEAGLLHDLIGLSAFAIALPGFFLTTELLAREELDDSADTAPSSNMLAFTLVLLSMAYLPVISACLVAWQGTVYNQFDKFGYVFFLIGALGWVVAWKVTTADYRHMRSGALLFAVASVFALVSQIPGPNLYVLGLTLMLSIFALGMAYRNLSFAFRSLPFQVIMFLSFPKVSEVINLLLGTDGLVPPLLVKSAVTLAALACFYFLSLPIRRPYVPPKAMPGWSAGMTVTAACLLLGVLFLARSEAGEHDYRYSLPYLLGASGEWEGHDIADLESIEFYGRSNVINRQYLRGRDQVGVMIVPSDGNRKTIHTPEYCQMGLGWELLESQRIKFVGARGQPATARKLLLENPASGTRRSFIYWFGDESGLTISNYPIFLIADTWRKLFGQRTNWTLYVVWSDRGESAALDFLSVLPKIEQRERL